MKLNHKFALLLAGAVLAGSLTGCGASGTPASSAASSEAAASSAVSEAAFVTIPTVRKGYAKIPLALERVPNLLAIAFAYVRIHMA